MAAFAGQEDVVVKAVALGHGLDGRPEAVRGPVAADNHVQQVGAMREHAGQRTDDAVMALALVEASHGKQHSSIGRQPEPPPGLAAIDRAEARRIDAIRNDTDTAGGKTEDAVDTWPA